MARIIFNTPEDGVAVQPNLTPSTKMISFMRFAMILYQIIYVQYVATDQAALTHDSVCGLVDIPAIKSSTIS
jgi:hypothetical protein